MGFQMIITTALFLALVGFLGTVLIGSFIGMAVTPRFDRLAPLAAPVERRRD
jgi:hypothetical protein